MPDGKLFVFGRNAGWYVGTVEEISTLQLKSGSFIDRILINGGPIGGAGGGSLGNELKLVEGEYISDMTISSGAVVDRIIATTNFGQQIDGGGTGGSPRMLKGRVTAIGYEVGYFKPNQPPEGCVSRLHVWIIPAPGYEDA